MRGGRASSYFSFFCIGRSPPALSLFHTFIPPSTALSAHGSSYLPDDSLAILAALASPEVEVIGLTSTFGNVTTATATANCFTLLGLAGLASGGGGGDGGASPPSSSIPVAAGSPTMLNGTAKLRIADFVHGADGFGNTHPPGVQVSV